MAEKSRIEIARENVERNHPAPTTDPMQAGMIGAVALGAGACLFGIFAGFDVNDFAGAFVITVIVGFVAPYVYFRSEQKTHLARISDEYLRLGKPDGG